MRKKICLLLLLIVYGFSVRAQSVHIDWPNMMAKQDIVNTNLNNLWSDGLFTGNGLLGNMVYMSKENDALRIDIGRTDVYDHRSTLGLSHLLGHSRLSLGHFLLQPVGKIISKNGRLDLWNAEVNGTINTDKGSIAWRTLTFSKKNIILFDYKTTGDEDNFKWIWVPDTSQSPRIKFKPQTSGVSYTPNPIGEWDTSRKCSIFWQPMSAGGGYATGWKKRYHAIIISIGYDTKGEKGKADVVKCLDEMNESTILSDVSTHRNWWHHFYQQSFFSIPDARMQSFYWIQLYKMASATRSGKPAMDLQGPWTTDTPWPGYWFNLNLQLAYSPLYMSNHLEIASSLVEMVYYNKENLSLNIPPAYRYNAIGLGRSGGPDMIGVPIKVTKDTDTTNGVATLEMGNLNWILYYYWLQYRYSMDEKLKEPLIALLRKSTNYFFDVENKDDFGKIHLPYSYSPEYPSGPTRDCNYALSLFKWSCQTLLILAPNDKQAKQWQDVVDNLTTFPTDSTGLRIGADIGFTKSHRHYSHLLMIYPLQLMNYEQIESKTLIEQSLHTWHKNTSALQGYSFTGGASIYEMMGQGNEAYQYLNTLLQKYVKHNTMYMESGPVIETPLAAVQSLQEMALQCRDGKIFVFHAVPEAWKDMSFMDLRADGAFLISGIWKNGRTQWIKVKSLVGGTVKLHSSFSNPYVHLQNGKTIVLNTEADGTVEWQLKKGESVIFSSDGKALDEPVTTVPFTIGKTNYWGVKEH